MLGHTQPGVICWVLANTVVSGVNFCSHDGEGSSGWSEVRHTQVMLALLCRVWRGRGLLRRGPCLRNVPTPAGNGEAAGAAHLANNTNPRGNTYRWGTACSTSGTRMYSLPGRASCPLPGVGPRRRGGCAAARGRTPTCTSLCLHPAPPSGSPPHGPVWKGGGREKTQLRWFQAGVSENVQRGPKRPSPPPAPAQLGTRWAQRPRVPHAAREPWHTWRWSRLPELYNAVHRATGQVCDGPAPQEARAQAGCPHRGALLPSARKPRALTAQRPRARAGGVRGVPARRPARRALPRCADRLPVPGLLGAGSVWDHGRGDARLGSPTGEGRARRGPPWLAPSVPLNTRGSGC